MIGAVSKPDNGLLILFFAAQMPLKVWRLFLRAYVQPVIS